jgi:hypothetical protein
MDGTPRDQASPSLSGARCFSDRTPTTGTEEEAERCKKRMRQRWTGNGIEDLFLAAAVQ